MIVDSVASCCQQKYVLMLLLIKMLRTLDEKEKSWINKDISFYKSSFILDTFFVGDILRLKGCVYAVK